MTPLSRRRFLATTAACLAAVSCARGVRRHIFEWVAFATTIRATLITPDSALASRAAGALRSQFARRHKDWYAWGSGELAAVNRQLAVSGNASLSPDLAALLQKAIICSDLSGRRFSASVAPLVELWGFHRFDRGEAPASVPEEQVLAGALAITSKPFRIDMGSNGTAATISSVPGAGLDIGGIAKGAALAGAIDLLRDYGIESAIVDAGGDIATTGDRADGDFLVGIQAARGNGSAGRVTLAPGECIMTSGDYARFWMLDGRRYQHIIDPRTGWPATGAVSASVIDTDPALADAAATALVVSGGADFRSVCDAMQVQAARLVDNNGLVHMTGGFRDKLRA